MRKFMVDNLTAVRASNQKWLTIFHTLAASPERLTGQDTPAQVGTEPLRRRETDVTLVSDGDQAVITDDNAQLHQLLVGIVNTWQVTADGRLSVPADTSREMR